MRNTKTKILTVIAIALMLVMALAMSVSAEDASGYVVGAGKVETNIKWTVKTEGEDVVAYFEIDASATDKVQTTKIEGYDPVSGVAGAYATPIKEGWGQNAGVTKVVIGDGITALGGGLFILNKTIKTVEIPASLTTFGWAVFEHCNRLSTITIRGNEVEIGTVDFSNITNFTGYDLHVSSRVSNVKKVILSKDYAGDIPNQFLCFQQGITEFEVPAGVKTIKNKAFMGTDYIQTIIVNGKETVFESDEVFASCTGFPKIKGYVGSKAEEFAKANGYTFINIETGEEVFAGTKAPAKVKEETPVTPVVTPKPTVTPPTFNSEGATAWGHLTGSYNGSPNVDTYWAYYADTKTMEFTASGKLSYCQTGNIKLADDGEGWKSFRDEIEHVIIHEGIHYIDANAFYDWLSLKDVRMPASVTQFGANAFTGCKNLTTIWVDGGERVEGAADFTGFKKFSNAFSGTAIETLIVSEKVTAIDFVLPRKLKNLYVYCNITEDMIKMADENSINLFSKTDPTKAYKFYVEIDPSWTLMGDKCGYSFDEATGTLTVHGMGSIDDVINYHGGGSKLSPIFPIKSKIKHIVLDERITGVGMYAFAYCMNLETVQLSARTKTIVNGAFEGCENLKSIYIAGNEPITGTIDLSSVETIINSWTFAYNYLIANVIINPTVDEIGGTAFEEAINIQNVYGTPGTFAEEWAATKGYTFLDVASNTPSPVECTPPETTVETEETTAPESETETDTDTEEVTTDAVTTDDLFIEETDPADVSGSEGGMDVTTIIIIVVIVVVVLGAAAAAVLIIKKKKTK
ncbi:MAG: leucine-rich repeat protein [Clostridia bacterium]|nr:leucine-rich repeat protein [Clostridia bacterium]